ncbi:hypothetical protein DH2020_034730 [Rehmannia glutinosa]|uniref:Uncharacterized protein n=1 Tax=Rehmannia glutinosa TaxID=99300 RepID=A0ABR0VAA2_REHGL
MDEFGVLVESIGFKAHGKSAPMAKLKPKPESHFAGNTSINTPAFNDLSSLPVDELDGIFKSNLNIDKTRESQNSFGGDDIFGGPVSSSNQYGEIDLESVLNSSSNRANDSNSNLRDSVGSNAYEDLLGSQSRQSDSVDVFFGSQSRKSDSVDDLLGKLSAVFNGIGSETSAEEVAYDVGVGPHGDGYVDLTEFKLWNGVRRQRGKVTARRKSGCNCFLNLAKWDCRRRTKEAHE